MSTRWGCLVQGIVFLAVGVIVAFIPDDRHVGEAIVTLTVVFAVSAFGFVQAWREGAKERDRPSVPSSCRSRAGVASRPGGDG